VRPTPREKETRRRGGIDGGIKEAVYQRPDNCHSGRRRRRRKNKPDDSPLPLSSGRRRHAVAQLIVPIVSPQSGGGMFGSGSLGKRHFRAAQLSRPRGLGSCHREVQWRWELAALL